MAGWTDQYLGSALHQSGGDGLADIDRHGQAPHLRRGHPIVSNSIHDSTGTGVQVGGAQSG